MSVGGWCGGGHHGLINSPLRVGVMGWGERRNLGWDKAVGKMKKKICQSQSVHSYRNYWEYPWPGFRRALGLQFFDPLPG